MLPNRDRRYEDHLRYDQEQVANEWRLWEWDNGGREEAIDRRLTEMWEDNDFLIEVLSSDDNLNTLRVYMGLIPQLKGFMVGILEEMATLAIKEIDGKEG
ncbi:MAG: hypothetical protein KUG64_10870 [Cycloclasticus sp.]|nr:hypothetical protein [Cycloclasticus sp.]